MLIQNFIIRYIAMHIISSRYKWTDWMIWGKHKRRGDTDARGTVKVQSEKTRLCMPVEYRRLKRDKRKKVTKREREKWEFACMRESKTTTKTKIDCSHITQHVWLHRNSTRNNSTTCVAGHSIRKTLTPTKCTCCYVCNTVYMPKTWRKIIRTAPKSTKRML